MEERPNVNDFNHTSYVGWEFLIASHQTHIRVSTPTIEQVLMEALSMCQNTNLIKFKILFKVYIIILQVQ